MICKKCGAQIDDKSVFCIHCGTKVEAEKPLKAEDSANQDISAEALKCRKCGNLLPAGTKFYPNCGTKTGALKKQGLIGIICGCVALVLVVTVIMVININARKSPIEGVSKKIYAQGMQYLEDMNAEAVKEEVAEFISDNPDVKMNEIAGRLTDISFKLDLGKRPTDSELAFNEAVNKIWEVTCVCHAQEALLETITKDMDSDSVQIASLIYKDIISEQKDKLQDAVDALESAEDLEDLNSVCEKADTIFTDSKNDK